MTCISTTDIACKKDQLAAGGTPYQRIRAGQSNGHCPQ
jgi:hypothetical protein